VGEPLPQSILCGKVRSGGEEREGREGGKRRREEGKKGGKEGEKGKRREFIEQVKLMIN